MIINIQEIFDNKLKELQESGEIENQIKEHITKGIEIALRNVFGGYEFNRMIEKEISPLAKNLNLKGYNTYIAEAFNTVLSNDLTEDFRNKTLSVVEKLFLNVDKKINVSQIIDDYKEYHFDYDDEGKASNYDEINDGEFFAEMKGGYYKNRVLEIAYTSEKISEYFKIEFKKENSYTEDNIYYIDSIQYKDHKISESGIRGIYDSIALKLIGLYYNKAKIIMDIDIDEEIETYISENNYD